MMNTARIFISGNSQAVRLPKAFRFDDDQVAIFRRGDEVVLKPIPKTGACVFDALTQLPNDMAWWDRQDTEPQIREVF
jgi:antitoxin VapB